MVSNRMLRKLFLIQFSRFCTSFDKPAQVFKLYISLFNSQGHIVLNKCLSIIILQSHYRSFYTEMIGYKEV